MALFACEQEALASHDMMTAVHKHYTPEQWKQWTAKLRDSGSSDKVLPLVAASTGILDDDWQTLTAILADNDIPMIWSATRGGGRLQDMLPARASAHTAASVHAPVYMSQSGRGERVQRALRAVCAQGAREVAHSHHHGGQCGDGRDGGGADTERRRHRQGGHRPGQRVHDAQEDGRGLPAAQRRTRVLGRGARPGRHDLLGRRMQHAGRRGQSVRRGSRLSETLHKRALSAQLAMSFQPPLPCIPLTFSCMVVRVFVLQSS